MRFSVVIATLGRPQILSRTIENVARTHPPPEELIVVDGDPGRSSEPATKGESPFPIRYLTADAGLPRQRNAGIDRAEGDVIVFVDDDVELPPNIFEVLMRVYGDDSVVGASARILEPASDRIGKKHSPVRRLLPGGGEEGRFTRYGYPRRLIDLDTERDIDFMHGSFMSVRRNVAIEVRFDERLPGYALAEDEDFSYRVSRRGRVRFVPELSVVHAKEGHGTRDARAFGRTVVINRSYLFRKNFRGGAIARFQFVMLIGLFMAHRLVNREWSEFYGLVEGSVRSWGRPLERGVSRPGSASPTVSFVSSHAKEGGSERYLSTLLDLLDRESIGSIVALEEGPLVSELRAAGHEVDVIHSTGSLPSMLVAARRLRRHLRSEPADVVHANGLKAALVTVLARPRLPIVWVKHDFSYDGALARWIAGRVATVVGVSEAALQTLSPRRRASAHVVHTGIPLPVLDSEEAREKLRSEIGAVDDDFVIGLVGRLHPVKGHLDLIAAAKSLLAQHPNARFVLIGGDDPSEPEHGDKVRSAARVLGDRVHFLGHRDDISTVIEGLDAGVMTSHRDGGPNVEALPLTALEMLACGTPLIAYASGGIPELAGACALLVPSGDREGIVRALASVMDDPDVARQLSECGPKRVAEKFSLHEMVEKMLDIYRSAAKS